jgi:hypothetical protein
VDVVALQDSWHVKYKKKRNKIMNALESLIEVLSTPVAKRKGVTISAEECKIWVEELNKYEEAVRKDIEYCIII